MRLPVELIVLIGKHIRRISDFQQLRLVCRLFDKIFAPMVLSHIHLRGYPPVTLPGGASLRDLTRRCERLMLVKSLTIYSLDWLAFQPEGFQEICSAALCYLALAPTHPFRRLFSILSSPTGEIATLNSELASIQGQRYLKRLRGANLPNLERIKWHIQIEGPKTSRLLILKALTSLPALRELSLSVKLSDIPDMDDFAGRLTQVRGLRKLVLYMYRGQSSCYERYLRCFGCLIANNPDLWFLQLSWHEDAVIFPLRILSYLPTDRPLTLKHLVLDTYNMSVEPDVIPHLRSLESLDVYWIPPADFWENLAIGGIFIPSIKVGFVTETFCEYLRLNIRLCSLTISRPGILDQVNSQVILCPHLFRAIEGTNIEHLTIRPCNWGRWFKDTAIKASLRQCPRLRRITLVFNNGCTLVFKDIISISKTVSRLGEKVILEISGDDFIHSAFRACSLMQDPPLKSLQQRLEFSELQERHSFE